MINIVKLLTLMFMSFVIIGCGNDNGDSNISKFDCDLNLSYINAIQSERYPTIKIYKATVIVVHGKTGSPLDSHMQVLASDLNSKGYDVIMPYMPWSGLNWNGTLCEGISHLKNLIDEEKSKGNKVILLGRSLAGPIVLAYTTLEKTTKPDALVVLAPGHFIHQSSVMANAHAPSIQLAMSMISEGQGDQITVFEIYNLGATVEINTSPEIYLSFHDRTQFPDIKFSIPLAPSPILWLAGIDDPLTLAAKNFGITALVQQNNNYEYIEIEGDHFSIVNNVSDVFDSWYQAL